MTRTVLILDDDRAFVDAVSLFLEDHGYHAITATRGEQALRELRATQVDLAIVDVHLVGTGGLDVAREIRSRSPGLPVIVISSDHDPGTRERSREAGAWTFLAKPIAPDHLLDVVAQALRPVA